MILMNIRILKESALPGVIFRRLNRHDTEGIGCPVAIHSSSALLPME